MSGSAGAFGCREESGVHPDGERLSGFVGGGLHGVSFGFGGADAQDFAARVVEGRSPASFGLTHGTENIRPRNVLTETEFIGHNKGMTTTAAWTHPLSTETLYKITSNTTDPQNRAEAMAEIERREECCSDCFAALDDTDAHCQQCGDHVDGLGECQAGCDV